MVAALARTKKVTLAGEIEFYLIFMLSMTRLFRENH